MLAVSGTALSAVLQSTLMGLQGARKNILDTSGAGVHFKIDFAYAVHDVDVSIKYSPTNSAGIIEFDEFEIDLTFCLYLDINFNDLYDALESILPLPPRCITGCVPFTDICATVCLDLGEVGFWLPALPQPSVNLAALYQPAIDETPDAYIVYPQIDTPPVLIIDTGRMIDRYCHAIADELPWPLSKVSGAICDVFDKVFEFFEDLLGKIINDIEKKFFDDTGLWIGVKIKAIKLFELDRHKFPGTGTSASNPAIPVQLNQLEELVNSSDELEIRVLVLPK